MNNLKLLLISISLSGCGCGFDKGDIVTDKLTGETGVIESINDSGRMTEHCQISVRYPSYRSGWIYGFYFEIKAK